ncbi:MAG: sugar ABC transporter permease [Candidatus Aerophobus sp.]|nr:MAG: sugar ABC transporter permease [Candidatus Aerophobus sp.]
MRKVEITKRLQVGEKQFGILLLIPALLVVTCLMIFPVFYQFSLAFYRKHPLERVGEFVGLANFIAVFHSPEFWNALLRGAIWTGGTVSLQLAVGIGMALLLYYPLKGTSIARGFILFPYVVPIIAAALVWRWLFNDLYGIINYFLTSTGLTKQPIIWLGSPNLALFSCITVAVWKYFPFVVIATLARLQTIPKELYEAARSDGANSFQRFIHVTLPQLREVLFVVILLLGIFMFGNLEVIWLLTRGGPIRSSETLPVLVYNTIYGTLRQGLGAAVAIGMIGIMMAGFVVYSTLYSKFIGR